MTNLIKRLFSGSAWALFFGVCNAVVGLVITGLLARLLNVADLGLYFVLVSVIGFMTVLTQMGMGPVAVRFITESIALGRQQRSIDSVRMTLRFVLIAGITLSLAWYLSLDALASSAIFTPAIYGFGGVTALWFVSIALQQQSAEILRAVHDIRLASLFGGTASKLIAAPLLFFLFFSFENLELKPAVLVIAFSVSAATLWAGLCVNRRFSVFGTLSDLKAAEILTVAGPVLITNIGIFIVTNADILIIASFAEKEDVALYGVALRLVTLIAIPLGLISASIQPLIVELYTKRHIRRLEILLKTAALAASIPAVLVLIIIGVAGDEILSLAFGDEYAQAFDVLLILCAGRVINVLCGLCGQCLLLAGQQKIMMLTTTTFATLAIVLSILVVKPFGIVGVAWVFSASMATKNVIEMIVVKKVLGLSTLPDIRSLLRQQ